MIGLIRLDSNVYCCQTIVDGENTECGFRIKKNLILTLLRIQVLLIFYILFYFNILDSG